MNLNDFETYFDETILVRGLDYYESGNVISLEYDGEEWIADVLGSDDYTVTVAFSDNGEILDTECDCPYDWGKYCKHQAAVLYALRKKLQSGNIPAKSKKKESLETVLKNLDNQTLISIILEFADRDKRMRNEIFLRYTKKTDSLKSAREVIRSSIDAVKRHNFVEYRDVSQATYGAYTVLQMIDDEMDSSDIMTTVSLCIVVLEEMMDLIDYCDDSNGHVGGVICESIEKIDNMICDMSPYQKDTEKIFDVIFNHAKSSIYNNWTDWRIDLLSAILPLCSNRINRDKLEQYISSRYDTTKTENRSHNYDSRQLQRLQYEIIKQFDDETAATTYMEQHLDNSDFRRNIIQISMRDELYDKALDLCLDGERKDSEHAGLVEDWRKFRYEIYEKTENIKEQKTLALELLLKGDFEYFSKLKALYKNDEWQAILQHILEKLENNPNGLYVKILIHENLKQSLLEYCKNHVNTIASYYSYLLPEYKTDVDAIFIKYIDV